MPSATHASQPNAASTRTLSVWESRASQRGHLLLFCAAQREKYYGNSP